MSERNEQRLRRRVKALEKASCEMLEAMGDPDWGFENGYGSLSGGGVQLETYLAWCKLLGYDPSNETPRAASNHCD